jgi:hypothetical protein
MTLEAPLLLESVFNSWFKASSILKDSFIFFEFY